ELPPLYLKILELLSPTKLACFLFLFGALGTLCLKFLPGYLSAIPALVLGWILANLFFKMLGAMFSRMDSSSNFSKESLIGAQGELTLSIQDGGLGEVLIQTGTSRYPATAKAAKPEQNIKKLTKVIVVDIKDGIFLVEPFEDDPLLTEAGKT
ncbi:MAG: hypothetical protein K2X27_28220, partial [Candidatus Obscuribacterales bacterium]|nr:hypothetical protein [Candidatus Obscuribacterales bacterium]